MINIAQNNAKTAISSDREQYYPIFEIIENFIRENNLIVRDAIAKKILLKDRSKEDVLIYHVYTIDIKAHAHALANIIYKHDPDDLTRYTSAVCKRKDEEYMIITNQREVCNLRSLPIHRNVSIYDVLQPSYRKGIFVSQQMACIGAEMLLLDIYDTLMNPQLHESWPTAMDNEVLLRSIMLTELHRTTEQRGGLEDKKTQLVDEIIQKFINPEDHVIIGDYSWEYDPTIARLQIITRKSLISEKDKIMALFPNVSLQHTLNKTQVPSRIALNQLTIYWIDSRKQPILNIYDAAQNMLIPSNPFTLHGRQLRRGTLYTQAKFYLIEMWILSVLLHMKIVESKYYDFRMNFFVEEFKRIFREKFTDEELFPKDYIGVLIDPDLAHKRSLIYNKAPFVQPYYPVS